MCGIAGIFHADLSSAASPQLLQRMTAALAHRGPDGEGFHLDGPAGLGHRRLSIIDVGGGKQPIFNEDRTQAIVFNGEIYNFGPLRELLVQKGHRFQTRSDTEAIVHAYEEFGERCVEHLRGMFAFAIWDGARRELFLARDRLGIKPLYYYWDGRKLLFASEIKALLEDPTVERTLDPLAIDDYLTYLYVPAPRTIFKNIYKLPPAHTLTVSGGRLTVREYWDLSFEPRSTATESECAGGLLEKLRESVSIHLMSEVPLGAFLSGGIDSSAVVGIMAGLLDQPVNTASIGFREHGFDELPYANLVAQRYRTRAVQKTVEASAVKILDDLAWHFDEPFADSSAVPTYYVSQVAREQVTVCLSGDGGDESFAGYRRYRIDAAENRLRRFMPTALRGPAAAFARVYPKADWLPRVFRGKTLLTNLSLSPEEAYFHTMSWFSPAMKRQLYRDTLSRAVGDYDPYSVMRAHFDRTRGWDPLSRIQYVDIKTYLVDDILTKVDRASMAHSLEVRVPLLDHEVVEYAAALPARYKLRAGEGKYILKKALAGIVPTEILDRRKMGFSIPLAGWLRGDLKGLFEDRVLARDAFVGSLFDTTAIARWWGQHQRGTRDYSAHLWALLVLESWAGKFGIR